MYFSDETIAEWRQGAGRAWASQFPVAARNGWSICPVEPTPVVAAFSTLWLRPGMALHAYQYRWERDGHTLVFALPAGEPLPVVEAEVEQPARPVAALDDLMEAIDGDGSLESYLQASILRRELDEFGALGHGMNWSLYRVLGQDVWPDTPLQSVSPTRGTPSGTPDMWMWSVPVPDDYRAMVERTDTTVTVVFYTYSALGQEQITRHQDTFHIGAYAFQTSVLAVATGPQGYVI